MKCLFRMLLVAAASLAAGGCGIFPIRVFTGSSSTFEQDYARLLGLYQAGKINALELTARQEVLRYQQGIAVQRAEAEAASASESEPTTYNDTDSSKKEDKQKTAAQKQCPPPPRCPPPPPRP